MARNWQEHYCIADNLLHRVEMTPLYLRQGRIDPADLPTLDLARTHALLAALKVEPGCADKLGSPDG